MECIIKFFAGTHLQPYSCFVLYDPETLHVVCIQDVLSREEKLVKKQRLQHTETQFHIGQTAQHGIGNLHIPLVHPVDQQQSLRSNLHTCYLDAQQRSDGKLNHFPLADAYRSVHLGLSLVSHIQIQGNLSGDTLPFRGSSNDLLHISFASQTAHHRRTFQRTPGSTGSHQQDGRHDSQIR